MSRTTLRIGLPWLVLVVLSMWSCEHAGPLEAPGNGPLQPTLDNIQTTVFDRSCALPSCHSGGGAPFGLDLDRGRSFASLVNVPSGEMPALLRVRPGNPDSSYIVWKIEGRAGITGERMPLSRDPLSAAQINLIRKWIADGAKEKSGDGDPKPPSMPTGFVATGSDSGCIDLAWNANPEADITGHTIYFDTLSVDMGAIPSHRDSVEFGNVTWAQQCGLANGTYYFALRAKNAFGLLSARTAEDTATVTNTAAQLSVTIEPARDNTLYENASGTTSNGAGAYFFAGRTGQGFIRRGLVAFDVAGSVPAGATVTSATLTLHVSRVPAAGGPETIALHRVTTDWGEGASDAPTEEGGGAFAMPGDATWIHSMWDTDFWNTVGGDFSAAVAAGQTVDGIGFYSWTGAGMIADVQSWLDDAPNNFGWILIGDEVNNFSAKRFDTHENRNVLFHPQLIVEFTPMSLSTENRTAANTPIR